LQIPEMIRERRSIRAFSDREVPEKEAELLVEAACLAPSAGNRQPWEFVIVRDDENKRRLAEAAYGQYFIAEAPVVFVVCADPGRSASRYGRRGTELYCLQDTSAAVQNLLLTAKANGLGSRRCSQGCEARRHCSRGLPGRGSVAASEEAPLRGHPQGEVLASSDPCAVGYLSVDR